MNKKYLIKDRKSKNLRILLFLILFFGFCKTNIAQTEYVLSDNSVYSFLERMESLQLLERYNSLEIPKTRGDIGNYLKQLIPTIDELDRSDKKLLVDYIVEFENEVHGTVKHSIKLIDGDNFDFLSDEQKYLYFITDKEKNISLFFNSTGQIQNILDRNSITSISNSASILQLQFQIRGSFFDKFGFFYRGGNGTVFGERAATRSRQDLNYNFKYSNFGTFDITTAGYLTADFDYVKFKFGRDRINIGYGPEKIVLGNNAPIFDNLSLRMHYKSVEVSYFHGKLLGQTTTAFDSIQGEIKTITDKYIGYHRIGFNFSDDFNIGAGEIIIYGDRGIDLNYVNPFILYKTAQNNNKDRDNSMVIIDINNKSIKGLKFYSTILMDDIELSKIGSPYWGNQFIISAGFVSNLLYKKIPLDIQFQYVRIDPYVYTNRIRKNKFTNDEFGLASFMEPNSELFLTQLNYRFTNRLLLTGMFTYYIHGANLLNPDGSVKENVGGDILVGHRQNDNFDAKFLAGDREYTRKFSLSMSYEPFNNYFIKGFVSYSNQSLQNFVHNKILEAYLIILFLL
ncbi:MAG: hypothetical protein COW08_06420 [Ignavibacteriales bacterium CG12_big_fil_rev_8_21_14_0_65_30_8]|nr:MAG: hypothetical protein COW08_06420 [Ignavibacteriales bacterium CG12_big_fil_rev_8_21_14_0_65_30_8]